MPQMKVCGIKNAAIAQMVEHVIGNDEVSSSNLLSSSKSRTRKCTAFSFCQTGYSPLQHNNKTGIRKGADKINRQPLFLRKLSDDGDDARQTI